MRHAKEVIAAWREEYALQEVPLGTTLKGRAACFQTATICSIENRFFFMENNLPFKVKFAEKLAFCPVLDS
jgi:hypothetical protein